MKKRLFAFLLAVTLSVGSISFLSATAAVNYDPCKTGNHVMEFRESVYDGYYGGQNRFLVDSCAHVSYPHDHYYVTYRVQLIYQCIHCAHTEVRYAYQNDTELGPICTVYDPGK